MRTQVCSKEMPYSLPRGDNDNNHVLIDLNCFLSWAMWSMGLLLAFTFFLLFLVVFRDVMWTSMNTKASCVTFLTSWKTNIPSDRLAISAGHNVVDRCSISTQLFSCLYCYTKLAFVSNYLGVGVAQSAALFYMNFALIKISQRM